MAIRQARRQLQFSGFEMGLIAVSFLVTVTAVFFLGLFVGKKNASYHAPTEDRVARIPVDDFTRYKRPAPIPAPPKEPRPVAPADTSAAVAATASTEAAKAAVPPAVPAEPMGPDAPVEVATAATTADAAAAGKAADKATDDPAAAEAAKKAKDAALAAKELAAREKEEKAAAAEETGRGYTVQILATRKSADADALVKKLKSRGFAAYIKKVSDGEGAWYRVRVGSYGAFSEARAMADKCRRDLGLGQAFVSTE